MQKTKGVDTCNSLFPSRLNFPASCCKERESWNQLMSKPEKTCTRQNFQVLKSSIHFTDFKLISPRYLLFFIEARSRLNCIRSEL